MMLSTAVDHAHELESRFSRLLAENGSAVARLAASYTRTASDRDDLFQDIAFALWQALPRFRGECSERTFLFRIAHNRAIAYMAKNRADRPQPADEVEITDSRPDPEAGLSQEQQGQRLKSAVQRLPVIYREVTTLLLEGMSYGEIAAILGIEENNVGVRLNRGRQMLRKLLQERR